MWFSKQGWIRKQARALRLKSVKLPHESICMDGQPYQTWVYRSGGDNDMVQMRLPTAKEDVDSRWQDVGTYRAYQEILEFIDSEGKLHIARDVQSNRKALEKAGFKKSEKRLIFYSSNTLLGETRTQFEQILKTPENADEQLAWAVSANNVQEVEAALAKGARVNQDDCYWHPIRCAVNNTYTPDRDIIVRRLLSEDQSSPVDYRGSTLLYDAMQSQHPTHTIISDLLSAGVNPFQLDNDGEPALLAIKMIGCNEEKKAEAQKRIKLVSNAMLKAEGLSKKEHLQIKAQARIADALIEALPSFSPDRQADVLAPLRAGWSLAYYSMPTDGNTNNEMQVFARVATLLEPLTDAAGAPEPLKAKGAANFLEIMKGVNARSLYTQLEDMTREFTAHVVLPQALLEYSQKHNQPLTDKFLVLLDGERLLKALVPHVERKLFGERSIDKIIGLSKAWHDPQVVFPDSLLPIKALGEWHPLTEEKILRVPDQPDITIHALTTSLELEQEGETMKHCVGGGNYTSKCLAAESHIFSVHKEGEEKPLSTIEAKWDGKTFEIEQNYGEKNKNASPEAKKAAAWLKESIEKKELKTSTTLGETDESKAVNNRPEILRTIGFEITQENINAAFAEYTHNPKRRAREYNPVTKEFDTISRRTELIAGNYNKEVVDEDGKRKSVGASLKELPANEWYSIVEMGKEIEGAFNSAMPEPSKVSTLLKRQNIEQKPQRQNWRQQVSDSFFSRRPNEGRAA